MSIAEVTNKLAELSVISFVFFFLEMECAKYQHLFINLSFARNVARSKLHQPLYIISTMNLVDHKSVGSPSTRGIIMKRSQ